MVACLDGSPGLAELREEGFDLTRGNILDTLEPALVDDLPNPARDELDLVLRIPLVAQVPLEVGKVFREGAASMLSVGVTYPGPPEFRLPLQPRRLLLGRALVGVARDTPHDAVCVPELDPPFRRLG